MASALVIDDSASARRMTALLIKGLGVFDRVFEAEDGLEGLRKLAEHKPDVVICDLEMPRCDGERFLVLRGKVPELRRVPVLIVTASHDPEHTGALFELGAADVVRKPFHPRELCARVQLQMRLRTQENELVEVNRHLLEISNEDALTGLRNRRCFDTAIAIEVERAHRHGLPLSLAMIDLDHFKRLNDRHGHLAGDAVLAHVGRLAKRLARRTDFVARYGGEELVALLPHTTAAAAWVVAERLRGEIANTPVMTDAGPVSVTASIGVADLAILDARADVNALVHAADVALYRAKSEGRDRIVVASLADPADPRHRDGPPTLRLDERRSIPAAH